MRVMTVNTPGSEDAFGEAILARATDVIHDFVAAIFHDRFTNARRDIVKRGVPGCLFPFSGAAFTGALEWKKNAIGIVNLVECRRTLGAIAAARTRVFRIAFK